MLATPCVAINFSADYLQVMDELSERADCTDDFRVFIDMIRTDMLVVHQPEHEEYSPQDRHGSGGSDILSMTTSNSRSLPVPGQDSPRRKSCGDILSTLGAIRPRNNSITGISRQSTMEVPSPTIQSTMTLNMAMRSGLQTTYSSAALLQPIPPPTP